jgi:PAS domain S-box-containing protein
MTPSSFQPGDFGIGRLFRIVHDGVIVANARTERIVLWNVAAEGMFGYTEDEALALPLHALVPEQFRDLHRAGLARYQESGTGALLEGGLPVELLGLHKDGHEVPIELTLTKVPEPSPGGDRYALAIIRDISERRRAEQAQRKLDEVAGDRQRAFDLNNTIVQGLAVAKMALEEDQLETGLKAVTDTLREAQDMITRMLEEIEKFEGPLKPGDLILGEPAPEPPST